MPGPPQPCPAAGGRRRGCDRRRRVGGLPRTWLGTRCHSTRARRSSHGSCAGDHAPYNRCLRPAFPPSVRQRSSRRRIGREARRRARRPEGRRSADPRECAGDASPDRDGRHCRHCHERPSRKLDPPWRTALAPLGSGFGRACHHRATPPIGLKIRAPYSGTDHATSVSVGPWVSGPRAWLPRARFDGWRLDQRCPWQGMTRRVFGPRDHAIRPR